MRKREYLSPSSIATFFKDRECFYLRYLTDEKLEADPQTAPMSVGSAFDAYCKHNVHVDVFGSVNDEQFEFDTIFTTQVEPHNRDFAREAGKYVFEAYKESGAYSDLLYQLVNNSLHAPRMEFEIRGNVCGTDSAKDFQLDGEVTLLGKPDLYWMTKDGHHVVFDWKVNGYCGKGNTSPKPGYLKLRNGVRSLVNYNGTHHKDAVIHQLHGQFISAVHPLEKVDSDWASQLSIYGWLLGIPIGTPFLTFIDQTACKANEMRPAAPIYDAHYPKPILRFAEHRTTVSQQHQIDTYLRAVRVWKACTSGHVFDELPIEESKARQEMLDLRAEVIKNDPDAIFALATKNPWN